MKETLDVSNVSAVRAADSRSTQLLHDLIALVDLGHAVLGCQLQPPSRLTLMSSSAAIDSGYSIMISKSSSVLLSVQMNSA